MKSTLIIPAILLLSLSTTSVYALNQTNSADSMPKTATTGGPLTDSTITAHVKTAFLEQKLFGKNATSVSGVKVVTNHGVVTLSGWCYRCEIHFGNTASQIKSVWPLVNEVVVAHDLNIQRRGTLRVPLRVGVFIEFLMYGAWNMHIHPWCVNGFNRYPNCPKKNGAIVGHARNNGNEREKYCGESKQ